MKMTFVICVILSAELLSANLKMIELVKFLLDLIKVMYTTDKPSDLNFERYNYSIDVGHNLKFHQLHRQS